MNIGKLRRQIAKPNRQHSKRSKAPSHASAQTTVSLENSRSSDGSSKKKSRKQKGKHGCSAPSTASQQTSTQSRNSELTENKSVDERFAASLRKLRPMPTRDWPSYQRCGKERVLYVLEKYGDPTRYKDVMLQKVEHKKGSPCNYWIRELFKRHCDILHQMMGQEDKDAATKWAETDACEEVCRALIGCETYFEKGSNAHYKCHLPYHDGRRFKLGMVRNGSR